MTELREEVTESLLGIDGDSDNQAPGNAAKPFPILLAFSGRISRSEFILLLVVWIFIGGVALLLAIPLLGPVVVSLASILWIPILLGIQSRRLHDIGASAWLLTLHLIPVLGALVLFTLCLFVPTQQGANRFDMVQAI